MVPSMGDSVSEGTVIEFPKQPGGATDWCCGAASVDLSTLQRLIDSNFRDAGDTVNEDDVLVQIETDKVTIDVRYTESQAGTLKEFLVKPEDTVTVGQEVAVVAKGEVSDSGGLEATLA